MPADGAVRWVRSPPHLVLTDEVGAGSPVARPVYRIACRRRKALRRNVAVCSAWRVSARARLRSRRAASSTVGTSTGGDSP